VTEMGGEKFLQPKAMKDMKFVGHSLKSIVNFTAEYRCYVMIICLYYFYICNCNVILMYYILGLVYETGLLTYLTTDKTTGTTSLLWKS
jgi:hypothetical protein